MGYYIEQRNCDFFIEKEKFPHLLEAIKALAGCPDNMTGRIDNSPSYAWVDMGKLASSTSVADALKAWRWNPDFDEDGNINYIWFEGQKYGDDPVLFEQIAPWVRDDSFIEMQGEQGEIWRWVFQNGEVIEKDAKITWD